MANEFVKKINDDTGVNINLCYQCKTCSLSCPFASVMDILPHQVIRKLQTGEENELLESTTIWHCGTCETCVTRCPNKIDIPRVMDYLRQTALQKKVAYGDKKVTAFHKAFINSIRQWGRQYELGMLLEFKIRSRDYFSDIPLGISMMLKRKLPFLPERIKGKNEVKDMFNSLDKKSGI
ncbi:MAG: 4Fe-4S dicluster domain-containing protein [Dehalococcoidales bacterium]|nr:4Fe-4S dicluster domain-containing protein [Dehalococcoidales bacterium]